MAESDRPVSSFEKREQVLLTLGLEFFQLRQGDLWLLVLGPGKAQMRLAGTLGGVVQQTFVDVADLLDVQRTETQSPCLRRPAARHFHLQHLQRFEQMQDGAVLDQRKKII